MFAWPPPTTISELRGFLGLTWYYRKFIQNYDIIARPLTNLFKKGKFGWNEEDNTAFLALKQAMTTMPILAMPNFDDSFTIEIDASGDDIGAILSQQGKPITFISRGLGLQNNPGLLTPRRCLLLWRPYGYGVLISWENNSSFSLPLQFEIFPTTTCSYTWTTEVGDQASGLWLWDYLPPRPRKFCSRRPFT